MSWSKILKEQAEQLVDYDGRVMTQREKICLILFEKAEAGDLKAISTIFDRIEGRPKISMESNKEPIQVVISKNDMEACL